MPGRKTDVQDCEWMAELLRHGLLTGQLRPGPAAAGAARADPLPDEPGPRADGGGQPAAEDAGRRQHQAGRGGHRHPGQVGPGDPGRAGRGETDGAELAELAQGRLREKLPQLERALVGRVGPHQRFLVAEQLAHIDFLDAAIARVSAEIAERVRPDAEAIARLDTIPGVGRAVAEVLVAEIGTDMTRFPTAKHLASWAGLCPGNHESAGKRRSGKTRKGSPWLRACLVQAAHAAARTKGTYLAAQYRRLAARRGRAKAAVAVAHTILVIAYHLLTEGTVYRDLGGNYFDERDRQAVERRLVHRLEGLGYTVSLTPAA